MDGHKVTIRVAMSQGKLKTSECKILIDDKPVKLCQSIKFEMSVHDYVPTVTLQIVPDEIEIDGEVCVCKEVHGGGVLVGANQGEFSGPAKGAFAPTLPDVEENNHG